MALIRLGPFGIVPAVEPAEENRDQEKPGDQKPNDQKPGDQKPGDQKKLNDKIKFSDKINFFPWSKKNEGENQDKRERVIHERLVRFARVPRSTVFEFVTHDSFLLFILTNSK